MYSSLKTCQLYNWPAADRQTHDMKRRVGNYDCAFEISVPTSHPCYRRAASSFPLPLQLLFSRLYTTQTVHCALTDGKRFTTFWSRTCSSCLTSFQPARRPFISFNRQADSCRPADSTSRDRRKLPEDAIEERSLSGVGQESCGISLLRVRRASYLYIVDLYTLHKTYRIRCLLVLHVLLPIVRCR